MTPPDRHAELRTYATRLQSMLADRGRQHSIEQIEQALTAWFEQAQSDLILECAYHCVEASLEHAIARFAFDQSLRKADDTNA